MWCHTFPLIYKAKGKTLLLSRDTFELAEYGFIFSLVQSSVSDLPHNQSGLEWIMREVNPIVHYGTVESLGTN